MINPQGYPEKSPEWVLAKFFKAWEKRDWKNMVRYCQLSWVAIRHINPATVLSVIMAQFRYKFLDAKILETEEISPVTKDVHVEIKYKNVNIIKIMRRKVRLICEKAPMQPSPEGQWGINPTSMIKARR